MLKSINGLCNFLLRTSRNLLITTISTLLIWAQYSCSSLQQQRRQKEVENILKDATFTNHHSGLLILDPESGDTLYSKSANRFFIPASTVKIATLFTALKLIPDKIPTLKYVAIEDTLYFEGLGNPTTLHPYFKDSTLLKFLDRYSELYLKSGNYADSYWAPGWAWEDFDQSFAAERSVLPLYGNVVLISPDSSNVVSPEYFKDSVALEDAPFYRSRFQNRYYYPRDLKDTLEIPIHLSDSLIRELLQLSLGKRIQLTDRLPAGPNHVLFGNSRDSVLIRMMKESDNFLAEQLLIAASSALSDTLSSKAVIAHIMENELSDLKFQPRWVDGSGLSRYNLFTPSYIVGILHRIYLENGRERTQAYFPAGGVSGTLKDDFNGNPEPYLFAKSGSMGNTYCLSGFLKTRSGKMLIFSFMNNNFTISSDLLKSEMEQILQRIRDSN